MERLLGSFTSYFYAILRIVAGLLFACHGSQKLLGFPGTNPPLPNIASMPGIAGVIELVFGILIAIGLLTRIAAFISSGEMAFAYFLAHAKASFWPVLNRGELAVLYCFLFLFISAYGPGILSIDSVIKRPRRI